jgi:hypothetical protein
VPNDGGNVDYDHCAGNVTDHCAGNVDYDHCAGPDAHEQPDAKPYGHSDEQPDAKPYGQPHEQPDAKPHCQPDGLHGHARRSDECVRVSVWVVRYAPFRLQQRPVLLRRRRLHHGGHVLLVRWRSIADPGTNSDPDSGTNSDPDSGTGTNSVPDSGTNSDLEYVEEYCGPVRA